MDNADFAFLTATLPGMSVIKNYFNVSWLAEKRVKPMIEKVRENNAVKTAPEELKATEKFSVVSQLLFPLHGY